MTTPGWHFEDGAFQASVDALIETVHAATREGIAKAGLLVQANAQSSFGPAHSKGTPKTSDKPQSISGTLRRTTRLLDVEEIGHAWTARIGPTQPYGRRLELGFYPGDGHQDGLDSLGRQYNQPPYPFLKPGLHKSEPYFVPIMMEVWGAALGL